MMLSRSILLAAIAGWAGACANGHTPTDRNEPMPGDSTPAPQPRPTPPPESDKPAMSNSNDIAKLVHDSTLAELTWPKGKARTQLEATSGAVDSLRGLCADTATDETDRFKACEAMYTLGGKVDDAAGQAAAAAAYAAALRDGKTHNAWGLPEDVTSSATSRHLIGLGKSALPALAPLLADDRALLYEGSEEPTVSEMHDYRVYDLAGALIANILGDSYPVSERQAAVRKKAADALRAKLPAN